MVALGVVHEVVLVVVLVVALGVVVWVFVLWVRRCSWRRGPFVGGFSLWVTAPLAVLLRLAVPVDVLGEALPFWAGEMMQLASQPVGEMMLLASQPM